MSNFKSGFRAIDLLYENHLTVIKGINFTLREIDIIACILHNRGEKKDRILISYFTKNYKCTRL